MPFTFWVVFFAFYRLVKAGHFGYEDAIWQQLGDPMQWVNYFALGSVQYHMHFLPTLFGIILFFPIFRFAVNRPVFGFLILFCLIAKQNIDSFLWVNARDLVGFDYLLRLVKILTYLGYGMVAGAFWGLWQDRPKGLSANRWFFVILCIGGILFGIKLAYAFRVAASGHWDYNFAPGFWADFLMPVLLFALLMMLSHRNWPIFFSKAAPYSFGLYLCHPIFIDIAEVILITSPLPPIVYVFVKAVFSLVFTCLLVIGISRTSLLSWTIGLGKFPFHRMQPHGASTPVSKGKKC